MNINYTHFRHFLRGEDKNDKYSILVDKENWENELQNKNKN